MKALYDYNEGIFINGCFEMEMEYKGAQLGYFVISDPDDMLQGALSDGDKVALILYEDNSYFTTNDWQGRQPDMSDLDEVAESTWLYGDGGYAIMFNGLPKVLR